MATLTIEKTWIANGTPADPTSMTLGIVRNDTGATVLASGTAMNRMDTGIYEYMLHVDGGTTYTATVVVIDAGQTYTFTIVAVPEVTSTTAVYPDNLSDVLNQLTALLLQVTLTPKPSYAVHKHNYSWTEYQEMLTRQIEQVTKLLAQANPFEIVSGG